MGDVKLYRKRVIPEECLLLDKDVILYRDPEVIITKWDTIHPKKTLHHGYSCYFIDRGFKVSKFYDHDGNLISWYCDIICHTYDPETEKYLEKLGAINCQMAQIADTVTEVVYGIPIFHKKTGEERKNEEILS